MYSFDSGPLAFRNRIINGYMRIDQRNDGVSQTYTAAAALAYSVNRFYGYCTGANVTGRQVETVIANTFRYTFTGAASNTAVQFGTRLEAGNTADMAGSAATLQVKASSTSITSLTWTAYYANTTDTFGTIASPTRTQIATGTFNITTTEATYSAQISMPAAATTGIEIVFSCGALLATQTLTLGNVQLEKGTTATPFEFRPYGTELALCQRYCMSSRNSFTATGCGTWQAGVDSGANVVITFPVTMRETPVVTFSETYINGNASGTLYTNIHGFLRRRQYSGSGSGNISLTINSYQAAAEL